MTAGSIVVPHIIPLRFPASGKTKHEIDTTTPVEIKSDTLDVEVYYTLDGSKPELGKRAGCGEGSTLRYSRPVLLPEGKVSVRALAATSDGRLSAIVTKVFQVENVPPLEAVPVEDNELIFQKDYQQHLSTQQDTSEDTYKAGDSPSLPVTSLEGDDSSLQGSRSHTTNKSSDSGQRSRILRETDFLRCTKCRSPRPSDPFARYCLQCGAAVPPVPGQRLPPAAGGQMTLCVQCKTMVPGNTPSCVICEAPLDPQHQASLRLQEKVICLSCGTGNPAHISFCVTCEGSLLPASTTVQRADSAPPLPSGQTNMVSCSKCCRLNHSDARFCDWCGSKPGPPASCLVCSCCGASSHPYAHYCGSCGVFLEGPPRPESSCTAGGAPEPEQPSDSVTWQPVFSPRPPAVVPSLTRLTLDQQTQTSGLFYPSATELQRRAQQGVLELSRHEQARDRRPLLTAVSPGRGYWRQQVDHVCAHLRSYTQNNGQFRALLAEPRMGRMVSAVIEEDSDKVSLRITFSIAGQDNIKSSESRLLQEVGPEGRGQTSVVQQLLDEGADPTSQDTDGRPALVVAVVNGHHNVIPLLVQKGADINQPSGLLNNTALHEAAALGSKGLRCADTLLGCQAVLRRNSKGQTPYDLAVTSDCSALVSLLAAKMGQGILDKLVKPKTNLSLNGLTFQL
ncbi:double zinc ribbon and ankyrin repeat-containing protein 1 [Aplochiton taeniatus]